MDGSEVVVLGFERESYEQWCLALVMLKESLVSEIVVRHPQGGSRLTFRVIRDVARSRTGSKKPSGFGSVAREDRGLVFYLSPRELDYCLFFYLRCVRDGVSPVDHIDIEFDTPDDGPQFQLVLKVADVAPPQPWQALDSNLTDSHADA